MFGSLQGVREATVAQIAAVEGFSEVSARKVLVALGVQLPEVEVPPDPQREES